jgi:hypothetical protein
MYTPSELMYYMYGTVDARSCDDCEISLWSGNSELELGIMSDNFNPVKSLDAFSMLTDKCT